MVYHALYIVLLFDVNKYEKAHSHQFMSRLCFKYLVCSLFIRHWIKMDKLVIYRQDNIIEGENNYDTEGMGVDGIHQFPHWGSEWD